MENKGDREMSEELERRTESVTIGEVLKLIEKEKMFWSQKNVLISGSAGFIGSHLAERLVSYGANVTGADNLSTGKIENLPKEVKFFNVDLRDPSACKMLTQNQDYVVHTSANMGGIGYITRVEADIMADNLRMNINMLEASVKAKVKRFGYTSSACIYPLELQTKPDVIPLKEEDASFGRPNEAYGWEKLISEQLCRAFQNDFGLEIRITRYHNIYGPGADYGAERGKAICSLIRKAVNYPEEPFIIWGSGQQTRSFMYIDDCVDGTLALFESNYDKPMNIGSDRLVTIEELADMIIKVSGKTIKKEHDLTAPVGVMGRNCDLTLARKILGWEPKVSLEDGVKRSYKHIEEDIRKRQKQ